MRTTLRIPKDVHKRLKVAAVIHETTINDLVITLIEQEAKRLGLDKLKLDTGDRG